MGDTLPCGLGLPLRGCRGHCAQLPWMLQRKQAGGNFSKLGGTAPFTPSSWSPWSLTSLREGTTQAQLPGRLCPSGCRTRRRQSSRESASSRVWQGGCFCEQGPLPGAQHP